MLDDVRLLYYNGETSTFIRRGNTTNEDTVFDPNILYTISAYIEASFKGKLAVASLNLNNTNGKYWAIIPSF